MTKRYSDLKKIFLFSLKLSIFDLVNIYRRSIFGPWWITINTALFIIAISYLWSKILGYEDPEYMTYIATGYVFWWLILDTVNKSVFFFKSRTMQVRQFNFLFSIMRNIFSILLQHIHNFIFLLIYTIYFETFFKINILILLLNYFLVFFLLINIHYLLSIISARFHDLGNFIKSLMTMFFFLTPIIWKASSHKIDPFFLNLNPFFHFLEVCRLAFNNNPIASVLNSYLFILSSITLLSVINYILYKLYKNEIYYWVN